MTETQEYKPVRKVDTMTMITVGVNTALKLATMVNDGIITREELKIMVTSIIDAIFDSLGREQITL